MAKEEKGVLQRYDGRFVMLKIKPALDIGKICFSFVQYGQDNKATANADIYLMAEEFGMLMESVRDKSFITAAMKEKKRAADAGDKYPKAVYTSPVGGRRTDKGAVSRYFVIQPGAKADLVFRGLQFNADVSSTGAFVPKKGEKPTVAVTVSTSFHGLMELAYKWKWLEADYMSHKYTVENMRSDYKHEDKQNPAGSDINVDPQTASDGFGDDTSDDSAPFS